MVDHPEAPGDCYAAGYAIGRLAEAGDDVPHPTNYPHEHSLYHGMRAALGGRGLKLSAFLRVIPALGTASS